ncbi:aldose epimerase, partial [Devosia limi DSM 17137]
PGDRVSIEGVHYGMGQHGFARRSEFELVEASGTSCRYELASSEETGAYPFEFLLAVTHAVEGRAVTVTAAVSNRDTRPMPFGLGFHPAFVWPLPGAAGKAHSVTLDNGAEPALVRLAGGLVMKERLASPFRAGRLVLEPELFAADAMVFPEGAGSGLTYAAEGGPAIHLRWENLPNLALWSKPGAPFVCLEPWHGTAAEQGGSDELAARPYSVVLAPGAEARFAFTAEVLG